MKRVKNILLLSPPPPQDSPYYELARSWKVEVHFANLVEIQGLSLAEFREQGISPLDYNTYIFAGKQAIDHFFRLMQEMRLEIPSDSRFLCVGEAIAQHLFQFIPGAMRRRTYTQAQTLSEFIPYMRKHAQSKYLYVGGGVAPLQFFEEAARYNLSVATIRVYNVSYVPLPDSLKRKRFAVIGFPSVTSVIAWKRLYPDYRQGSTDILVFGLDTKRMAESEGLRVTDYAPREGVGSLLGLLTEYLRSQSNRNKGTIASE
ncbi:MAG: uroporphyrinogen-III synthase [Bacteroidia bacterium]|nr:uroporphyrinogen-III synthase [Bacteroidia bacterium]MCX7653009.1 uroporphyrinogen-III synthase [Bacteroidia bacterium]MDW8416147.1 uroporphyrinogen-III synthase [Bacteroidia bacterium]